MAKGVIFEDARLQLKTNAHLDFFEQQIKKIISRSSGVLVGDKNNADLILRVALTYGPTPAPAYRDYNMAKSMGISLLTLGLGPRSWSAVVDYRLDMGVEGADGVSVANYSNTVLKNTEEMKSAFNFSRYEEVQQLALAAFGVAVSEDMSKFVAVANQRR